MGERKLNFDAPFLSARRFSIVPASASENNRKIGDNAEVVYKSDASLDQVTEAVTIPFIWEQIPGRAKNNNVRLKPGFSKEACVARKLPPGKLLGMANHPREKNSGGERTASSSGEAHVLSETQIRLPSSKDGRKEEEVSDSEDEVYCDALDTLSLKDSFSMNHGVSGASGFDSLAEKQTETSADQQNHDFMISRFLPAAMAMTLEQPQYASKKQRFPVMPEQPRETKKDVTVRRQPKFSRFESVVRLHYLQDTYDEESEDNDEDKGDEYDVSGNISRRGCGLLPQFCFKTSLDMLYAAPGLKLKAPASMYSSCDVGKPNKASRIKSLAQTVKKLPHAFDSVHKLKLNNIAQSVNGNKLSREANGFTNPGRSSPLRHSGCPSPYRNAPTRSPSRELGLPGTLKEAENLRSKRLKKHIKGFSKSQELLIPKSTRQISGPVSSAAEKTLCINTVNLPDKRGRKDPISREVVGSETLWSLLEDVEVLPEEVDLKSSKLDQEPCRECKPIDPLNIINSSIKNVDCGGDQILKADTGKFNAGFEPPLLPPPLPEKPSDSWLSRNLNSVTSRNPSPYPYLRSQSSARKQSLATAPNSTKWETIVKTSCSHHGNVRYSKQPITHFPQRSEI